MHANYCYYYYYYYSTTTLLEQNHYINVLRKTFNLQHDQSEGGLLTFLLDKSLAIFTFSERESF